MVCKDTEELDVAQVGRLVLSIARRCRRARTIGFCQGVDPIFTPNGSGEKTVTDKVA